MRLLYSILLMLLISSCSTSQDPNIAPAWIDNPGKGAVGSAQMHIKGRTYQLELAIARARNQLAARQGVNVNNQQIFTEHGNNNHSSVTINSTTEQKILNKTVKAKLIDKWCHPQTKECWVLLMP